MSTNQYGRNVDWSPYTFHDAASLLRRYLNLMPEPIVPLDLYTEFRNVVTSDRFEQNSAVRTYRLLINSCPPANQYLLLYVLDLLAVFAHKSELNRMDAHNLAIIFQPGILSHPSMLQSKDEHLVAVRVLEFLISNQQHFVLALSPPPPPNLRPEELTVSRPVASDVTIYPSDSDEELGDMVVHTGGGAYLQSTGRFPPLTQASSRDESRTKPKVGASLSRSNTTPTRRNRDIRRPRESTSTPHSDRLAPGEPMFRSNSGSGWKERLTNKTQDATEEQARAQRESKHLESPQTHTGGPLRSPRLNFLTPSALAHGLGQVPGLLKSLSPRSDKADPLAQAGAAMAESDRLPPAAVAPATSQAPAPGSTAASASTATAVAFSPAQARTPSLVPHSADTQSADSSVAVERESAVPGLGLVVDNAAQEKSLPALPAEASTTVSVAAESERPRVTQVPPVFPVDPTVAHLGRPMTAHGKVP